jgi:hypothetical protein
MNPRYLAKHKVLNDLRIVTKDGKLNETAATQEYAVTHAYRRSCFMGSCGVYLFVFPLDFADHDKPSSPLASSVVSAYRFILDVGLLFFVAVVVIGSFWICCCNVVLPMRRWDRSRADVLSKWWWTHVMKSREVPTGIQFFVPFLYGSSSHGLLMLSACDLYPDSKFSRVRTGTGQG